MKDNKRLKSNTTIKHTFRHILFQELKSTHKWRKIAIYAEDPESVHQMRISLRKIRTALFVFKPVISRKSRHPRR
jgi:CHAD domain-containing protein